MQLARWLELMAKFHFEPNENEFNRIVSSYNEKHRFYHSISHIDYCLALFDRLQTEMTNPCEVELALWYHDVVYKPLAKDNEEKSARQAREFLQKNAASQQMVESVYAHIMSTLHHQVPVEKDTQILVDIDLGILGDSEEVYNQFEADVRREYSFVPKFIFNRKRCEILQGILQRQRIYNSEVMYSEREQQARVNLKRAIDRHC